MQLCHSVFQKLPSWQFQRTSHCVRPVYSVHPGHYAFPSPSFASICIRYQTATQCVLEMWVSELDLGLDWTGQRYITLASAAFLFCKMGVRIWTLSGLSGLLNEPLYWNHTACVHHKLCYYPNPMQILRPSLSPTSFMKVFISTTAWSNLYVLLRYLFAVQFIWKLKMHCLMTCPLLSAY